MRKVGYLETTTGEELLLLQSKIQQHKNLWPKHKGLLWVPLKDSYGSLSRTLHGRGKLPHLFDNFMCVLFLLFFVGEEGPCVSLLGPFCGGGVVWRGRGIGASNFGLCVLGEGGWSKVFLLNFQLLFCEKGLLCLPYLFVFFSFQLFWCSRRLDINPQEELEQFGYKSRRRGESRKF